LQFSCIDTLPFRLNNQRQLMQRRTFLKLSAGAALAPSLLSAETKPTLGKAEHCIFLWLGGGMAHIDTFDPKKLGDAKAKPGKPGSYYAAIDTSVPKVQVCEHLSKLAPLVDRLTIVRTVNHRVVDEHAFATNLVHTGRLTSGNIVYPSIGSLVAHERGAAATGVPAYMLIGYPNASRGPGYLGAQHGYIYLVDTAAGPAGFTLPEYVKPDRMDRRQQLLTHLQRPVAQGSLLADYQTAQAEALRLAGPGFMNNFQLDKEPADLRNRYGGEFGQRCLMARRLIQAGVRFIEVSHNLNFINGTGWDTHNAGQLNQHVLIQELDTALAALISDLEEKQMLDKTLVVVATEFGRPASFDGGGGRGHQGSAFSLVLAGGGLKHCGAYGVTDDLAKKPLENPVSIADFHATIHAALGINPSHEIYAGSRPVPITDGGQPIAALFA
jgi:hypothetical protein